MRSVNGVRNANGMCHVGAVADRGDRRRADGSKRGNGFERSHWRATGDSKDGGWAFYSGTSARNTVPFYMLPSLGGDDTLRGYYDYRFHDRNLLMASAESRWALMRHLDVAAFFDAGNVAARFGDLDLRKTSWGGGVRVHSGTATFGRLDVGHSVEGWRVFFRLNDPFRLNRVSRRTADTPFVP